MEFDSYMNDAWREHASDPERVAEGFASSQKLITTGDQMVRFVALVTHVTTDHLGQWTNGLDTLNALRNRPEAKASSEVEMAIIRSIEVLKVCSETNAGVGSFSASDQIRILAAASSALATRNTIRSMNLLRQSLRIADSSGLEQMAPAIRALAVAGNNIACALESLTTRTPEEVELMVLAARTGRTYWELAGSWLEVSRAEYRLAMTYLKAGHPERGLLHAQTCVILALENKADAVDLFYGYEAIAVIERANLNTIGFQNAMEKVNHYFDKLSPDDKLMCESSLKALIF